jgi:hypothetical protein
MINERSIGRPKNPISDVIYNHYKNTYKLDRVPRRKIAALYTSPHQNTLLQTPTVPDPHDHQTQAQDRS